MYLGKEDFAIILAIAAGVPDRRLKWLSAHGRIDWDRLYGSDLLDRDVFGHHARYRDLHEFILYGAQHVFPAVQTPYLVTGLPTAWSAPPLNAVFPAASTRVWEHHTSVGTGYRVGGVGVEPLSSAVPWIASIEPRFWALAAMVEVVRLTGRRWRSEAAAWLSSAFRDWEDQRRQTTSITSL